MLNLDKIIPTLTQTQTLTSTIKKISPTLTQILTQTKNA